MKTYAKYLVLPMAIGALLIAGCGSDDSSDDGNGNGSENQPSMTAENGNTGSGNTTQGEGQVLSLAADPSGALAYDKTELTANAGETTLDFTNESPIGHDVVIDDADGKEVAATPVVTGQSTTTKFDAKPGTYTFFCSLPGHEQAGMKGTLTVK